MSAFGDVAVTTQVVGFRRIKRFTHETLGVQPLEFPPSTLETSAYWFAVQPACRPSWSGQASGTIPSTTTVPTGKRCEPACAHGTTTAAPTADARSRRARSTTCTTRSLSGPSAMCGVSIENYREANQLENLVLVCRACHQRLETAGRLRTGLDGLAYALANLAPVHLMCDPSDLGLFVQRSGGPVAQLPVTSHESPVTTSPVTSHRRLRSTSIERVPAGLGFSAQLYELHDGLLAAARELVAGCGCRAGCPACVGPVLEEQPMQLATKAVDAWFFGTAGGSLKKDTEFSGKTRCLDASTSWR